MGSKGIMRPLSHIPGYPLLSPTTPLILQEGKEEEEAGEEGEARAPPPLTYTNRAPVTLLEGSSFLHLPNHLPNHLLNLRRLNPNPHSGRRGKPGGGSWKRP